MQLKLMRLYRYDIESIDLHEVDLWLGKFDFSSFVVNIVNFY